MPGSFARLVETEISKQLFFHRDLCSDPFGRMSCSSCASKTLTLIHSVGQVEGHKHHIEVHEELVGISVRCEVHCNCEFV